MSNGREETMLASSNISCLVSEVPPRYNVLSAWSNLRNEEIVAEIEQEMIKRNTYQGKYYSNTL